MYAGSESRDHGLDLGITVNSVQTRLLNIQDLSSERKNSLSCTGPCCLG